jgi:VWFA-related protein
MPFPVLKRVGYIGAVVLVSGLLVLTGQEAAPSTADAARQNASTSSAAASDAPVSAQASAPSAGAAAQTGSTPVAGQQPTTPQPGKPATPVTAAAQQGSSTPAMPGTVLKVTTRMVLVDVVVTDGAGRPVVDLKSDDFEIKENGKLQTVRGFGLEREAPANTAIKPRVLPAGIYTNIPDFHPEAGPPTVLLIDALNTGFRDQPYMRQQLVKYLQKLEPRRNVAIYTLGTRLRLLQDFTNNPELLQTALKKFSYQNSSLNQDNDSEPDLAFGSTSDDATVAQMEQSLQDFQAEEQAFRTDIKVQITMDAFKRLARNLAGYPGRKNLVWLSGSFPLSIMPDNSLSSPFAVQRQYGDQLRETAGMLTDAQVAIYPVDARGLVVLMPDASQSASAFGGRRGGQALATSMSRKSTALQSSHDAMNELADQTGGHAYYNRNDIDRAIALSVAEGSTYYTLGYYPEDRDWDGKFRKIDVKVKRSGLRLHHRRGYFAIDPEKANKENEKAARREFLTALNPESPMSTSLPFVVRVTPPNKDQHSVLLDFSIEPKAIAFDPQGELHHAQIDFVSIAFDSKGKKQVANQSDTMDANLKPNTYAEVLKYGLRMRQKLDLAPGKYLLKFGVRDTHSNLIGTATAPVDVPAS